MVNTIETRLKLDLTQELDINSCVSLWSEFYRKIWVMFNNLHLEENVIWHKLMNTNLFNSHQVISIINKVKSDGNKLNVTHKDKDNNNKSYGFISWHLENKSTEQREWLISNAITEALTIAQFFGIYSIAIENLDFSSTINNMNSGYKAKSIKNKRNKVIFNYNIM